jgi:subtilisin family serine protease
VVNNSWGGGRGDYWFTGAVDAWRAAGVFPQFSNGNSGPGCETAGSPGDNWNTFSAGASNVADAIAGFSSRGPSLNHGFLKPDITAPGVSICSSIPGNTYTCGYSGTSMASPHVAGALALLWSANPELIGQIDLSGWVLQQTATPFYTTEGCGGDLPTSHPNNTWGWGLLNAKAAVDLAQAGSVTPDWLALSQWSGEVLPGETDVVTLTFTANITHTGVNTATLWLVADDPINHDVRLPITLTVTEPVSPTAEFTSNSPITLGETAVFTNTSTGDEPLTFLWDFGDGITSTLESPTHEFAAAGTYTVTLTASSPYGEDTVTHEFVVNEVPPVDEYLVFLPLILNGYPPEPVE